MIAEAAAVKSGSWYILAAGIAAMSNIYYAYAHIETNIGTA